MSEVVKNNEFGIPTVAEEMNNIAELVTITGNEPEKGNRRNVRELPKYFYKYDKNGTLVGVNTGVYVDYLITNFKAICASNILYIYEDGFYKKLEEEDIEGFIRENLDSRACTMHNITDIKNQWKIDRRVRVKEEDLNSDPFILNLENGLFDLRTKELKEHTYDYLSTIRVSANYNPDLDIEEAKTFKNYLDTSIPSAGVRTVVQEVMGYCITALTKAQKFFVLNGETNTGKSVLLNIIQSLVAEDNISHVKWQDLNADSFELCELHNRILNTVGDLPKKPIKDGDLIKELTGEDPMSAKRKNIRSIKFKNKAKMLFSTNGMPKNYGDKSEAFYQRLIIIPFNEKIKNKDKYLMDKLENEKDYIFNYALEGLLRLIENEFEFSTCPEIEIEVKTYKENSNTALQFINDYCDFDPSKATVKAWLLDEYRRYCKEELEVKPMGRNAFYEEIEAQLEERYDIAEEGDRKPYKKSKDSRTYKGIYMCLN